MRVLVVFLFVAGGIVFAAGESSAQGLVSAPERMEADGSSGVGSLRPCFGCRGHGFARSCGCDCGCGEDGNCACQGSYKYPVPSQYTYFWPGIYSQKTMTQYVSPWRYPDLNPIPEHWKTEATDKENPYSGLRY